MERKVKTLIPYQVMLWVTISLLTLHLFSCNSGRAVYQDQDTAEQRERRLQTVRLIIKARQRIYCLSADIKVASDTDRCFDCHDMIER